MFFEIIKENLKKVIVYIIILVSLFLYSLIIYAKNMV